MLSSWLNRTPLKVSLKKDGESGWTSHDQLWKRRMRKLSVYWYGKISKVCYKVKTPRCTIVCEWYATLCVKGGVECEYQPVFAFLSIKGTLGRHCKTNKGEGEGEVVAWWGEGRKWDVHYVLKIFATILWVHKLDETNPALQNNLLSGFVLWSLSPNLWWFWPFSIWLLLIFFRKMNQNWKNV